VIKGQSFVNFVIENDILRDKKKKNADLLAFRHVIAKQLDGL